MNIDIKQQLNLIFRDIFDDPSLEIRDEMTAREREDWDSLTHINLVSAIERSLKSDSPWQKFPN